MKAKVPSPPSKTAKAETTSSLIDVVRLTIAKHHLFDPGELVVLGVSGGPDSLCLLHVMLSLREDTRLALCVAHLDHGLRGKAANEDARYVEELADRLGLPATVGRVNVGFLAKERKLAIEEAARRARYEFLAQVARAQGARSIAVAHHADDQVESIIMHWLRGAGLAGLRGMRPLQPYPLEGHPELRLARPLLEVSRAQIRAFCQEQGIQPRWDLSNLDTTFYRNRIRLELLPLLETYNPKVRQVLLRSAQLIADDYNFIVQKAEEIWSQVARVEAGAVRFSRPAWDPLPPTLKRALLRRALLTLRASLRNLDWIHIQTALEALETKGAGTQVTLPRGVALFIDYDSFSIGTEPPTPDVPLLASGREVRVQVPGTTPIGPGWQLLAEELDAAPAVERNTDPWQAFLDLDRSGSGLSLRTRQPGDRFRPLGLMGQEKLLREFMIDAKIPRPIRGRLPLLTGDSGILWVCGYRLDEGVKVGSTTRRVLRLRFERLP